MPRTYARRLLEAVERLTPGVMAEGKGASKVMCANVDMC